VSEFTFGFYGYAKTAVGGQRFFSLSTWIHRAQYQPNQSVLIYLSRGTVDF
jgi:hypothetical protein